MGKKLTYDIFLEASSKGIQRAMSRGGQASKKMSKTISRSVKEANRAISRMTKNAAKIGAAFGTAGAAAGVYTFVSVMKDAISLANTQTKSEKKLAAVLKATGGAAGYNMKQLKAMASEMQSVTTVGDEVILNGMAMLATFKNVSKDGFKRATMAALDMSNVMDTDLKSSIVLIGKVLNDPIKNMSALTRNGVQFTDAQKAMITSLVESGNLLKAQDIVLKELESQFGGTAKAAREEFGGAAESAGNALGDMKEEMGFVITKNTFFIEIAKASEQQFIAWTKEINANRGALMQHAKDGAIGLLSIADAAILTADVVYRGYSGTVAFFQSFATIGMAGFATWSKIASVILKVTDALGMTKNASEQFAQYSESAFDSVKDLYEKAAGNFDQMVDGSEKLAQASGRVDQLRKALEKIDAKEVEEAANQTKKASEQLVNIGGKWVQVSKAAMDAATKDVEYASQAMTGEFDEMGVDWGRVWDGMQKDGIHAVDAVEDRIDKLTSQSHEVIIKVREVVQSANSKTASALNSGARSAMSSITNTVDAAFRSIPAPVLPAQGMAAAPAGGTSMGHFTIDINFPGSSRPVTGRFDQQNAMELVNQFKMLEENAS